MSLSDTPKAANDNLDAQEIRLNFPESPPLSVTEVEIFDALISNLEALVANDNGPPDKRSKL